MNVDLRWLSVVGLAVDFVGAAVLVWSLLSRTSADALAEGMFYWASDDQKSNLSLPPVKALLRDAKLGRIGFALLALGFLLQIVGAWPQ